MGGRGSCGREWRGCAQGGPDVRRSCRAGGKVCLGGEKRGRLGDHNFRGELAGPVPRAFSGRALARRPAPRPALQGDRAARVVEGARTGSLDARGPGLAGPIRTLHPNCSSPGLSFPDGEGRKAGQSGATSLRPHPSQPGTPRPAAASALAAALYSGKCLGLYPAAAAKPGGRWGGQGCSREDRRSLPCFEAGFQSPQLRWDGGRRG